MTNQPPTHRTFRLSLCDEAGTVICTYDVEVRTDPRYTWTDVYQEMQWLMCDIADDIDRTVSEDLSN